MRWLLGLALACGAWAQANWAELDLGDRTILYQNVDGQMLWQGDIVLGPVPAADAKGTRASSVLIGQQFRWPGNILPYVIDDDVPDKERVDGAIRHWNENTPMRLVARSGEANYVQFRRRTGSNCSSNIGMIGGRQYINLPDDCSLGMVIHEIGHAVGLLHTQGREDRDLYIRVNETGIARENLIQYAQQLDFSQDVGAYPFDSIMHYSAAGFALPGDVAMATVPAGIPLGQRSGLSASDIDTVIRVQGGRPPRTVIAANPSGLEVEVDGKWVKTPASFDWPAGSRHTVSINDSTSAGTALRFARWSDFGSRAHTIIASPDNTVFTVHMRRLFPLPLSVFPASGGRITLNGAAVEDGLLPEGSRIELVADPAPGFRFLSWSGVGYFSLHGDSNPIRFGLYSPKLEYDAEFTTSPITTITTSPPGLRIQVDNTTHTSPQQFKWAAGTRHEVSVETLKQTSLGGGGEHTWYRWSDDGTQRHTITAATGDAVLTAEFETRYQVLTLSSPTAGGRISIDPPPVDGFLRGGDTVTLTATPSNGYAFAGWGGNLPGADPQRTVVVSDVMDIQARFVRPAFLSADAVLNGASYTRGSVAPGEIMTLFGLDIGPSELAGLSLTAQRRVATSAGGVRVLFDGTPAPVLYASARQVGVIAPYNIAGKATVRVQLENNGKISNILLMSVAPAAPAFFAANSAGRGGGAFLNADGSLNTETNPAERGSIVVLYATGVGPMVPAMNDGELAAPPYAQPAGRYSVQIGERDCQVIYGGAAPGLVSGLVQLNVRVPADIAPGIMPVSLEVGGLRSPRTVSIAIR